MTIATVTVRGATPDAVTFLARHESYIDSVCRRRGNLANPADREEFRQELYLVIVARIGDLDTVDARCVEAVEKRWIFHQAMRVYKSMKRDQKRCLIPASLDRASDDDLAPRVDRLTDDVGASTPIELREQRIADYETLAAIYRVATPRERKALAISLREEGEVPSRYKASLRRLGERINATE